jgi:hypothetical protein
MLLSLSPRPLRLSVGHLWRFQLAALGTQSWIGLPAPLGTAIKITPKSLKDSAFLPATGSTLSETAPKIFFIN